MRVLLTGVGGPAGSSLARQLRSRGHWVAGVDVRDLPEAGIDHFSTVPLAISPDYVPTLGSLCRELRIDVLIPSVSEELVILAESVDAGMFDLPVLIGTPPAVTIANDKYVTARVLAAAEVAVPAFGLPSQFASAAAAIRSLGGAVVIKPRVSRGGRGVVVIDEDAARTSWTPDRWAGLDDTLVVQRFAPGPEFAPVIFRPDPEAAPAALVVLEKTALKQGLVGNAVDVVRAAPGQPVTDRVAELTRSAVEAIGLAGPADVDVRLTEDGAPLVLEINARFGANSARAPELLDAVLARLDASVGLTHSAS